MKYRTQPQIFAEHTLGAESRSLEIEFSTELKIARRIRGADLAETATCRAGAWVTPVYPVEDVKRIRLEDQAHAFFW